MNRYRRRAIFSRCLFFLTGLTALALLPQFASGQPKAKQTPQIIEVGIEEAKKKSAPLKDIDLRPNTPTELGFKLKNNAGEIFGDVTLKIVQVVDDRERVIAEAKIPKLDMAGDNPGISVQWLDMIKKVKGGPEKVELVGAPPFELQLHIQAEGLPLQKRALKLFIREPRDYVSATVKFNPGDNELRADVEPKAGAFIGQHEMPVELVLGPDIRPSKKGDFNQTLTGPNQKLTLVADEVLFERKLTEGDAYLKVDGYDRAFTYQVKENAAGAINPQPTGEIRVRIRTPRYARPDDKFELPLEIDGPLAGDYKVLVGLDRTGDTEIENIPGLLEKDGLRQQTVALSVSPAGKLMCRAEVRDWSVSFKTGKILSRNVKFRVSVVKQGEKMKLTVAPESRPLMAETKTDDRMKEVKSVFALVTVDESPPEDVKLELPKDKEWPVDTPLEVRASVKERRVGQAPIARAILYKGKPPEKEEVKAADILAEGEFDPKEKNWKFTLPPQGKPEPLTLSVQFTTVTDAKASGGTDTLVFKAATTTLVGKKLYKIKGVVMYGELKQPGLEVTLLDDKGKPKGTAKTDDKGGFLFADVEPGLYVVSSRESFRKLYGEVKVDVPAKDKKDPSVTVELKRGK